jgi:HSP20 family molecular chaperone IbpA
MEVQEDDTKYNVRVEVPGFTKQDIKVQMDLTTNLLTISGQKEAKEKEGTRAMSFTRSFTLPMDMDMDKQINARTEHGILTVELPKAPEDAQPKMKEIPVEGV